MGLLFIPQFYVPVPVIHQDEQSLSVNEECAFVNAVTEAVLNEEISQDEAGEMIDRQFNLDSRKK